MAGAHVLLVEPDRTTRLLVAQALRDVGHEVTEVDEPSSALALLDEDRFTMVVIAVEPTLAVEDDLAPAAEGGAVFALSALRATEIAERARLRSAQSSIVVLFLVAPEQISLLRPALDEPLTDFIVKPLSRESLEARLAVTARLLGALHDVRERKKLESRLVIADRMASLGTLAAGVAHEINNPLSYVMANVSHVSSELARRAEEGLASASELCEALDEALIGVDRIRKIVADLKTFSRPDEDGGAAVDVRRVLDSSVNMASNELRHRARLIKDYGPVPFVRGGEARLGQVFLNLLVNAAQAMPVGQASKNEIRVRTSLGGEGDVIVEVEDTGPGISEDVLRRVFDPFFTTKPVGEGTGLGLAICHAIVKGLGGDISVESVVGVGTTVRVSLPSAVGLAESSKAVRAGREPAAPTRRILVVDDEPLFASAVRRMLHGEHDVTLVESGREAVTLITEREFDVVLCDLMMPEVTGMDVFNEVRRSRPGYEERIVFMTGGAFTVAARQFLETVQNTRLEKPFSKDDLKAAVRRVADAAPRGCAEQR